MASIIIQTGDNKGDFYPLGHRTTVIGRDEALPIQVLDEYVSRKHLQIRYDQAADRYMAVDMQSKHGVLINGVRMTGEALLSDDDMITVGKTTMLFTKKDFDDAESALHHFKKVGERIRKTMTEQG